MIILMGHDNPDIIREYYMNCNQFLHTLRFPHFENNENLAHRTNSNYDKLWKLRRVFEYLKRLSSLSITLPEIWHWMK